eukprot:3152232-Amphidinium_carterae.1
MVFPSAWNVPLASKRKHYITALFSSILFSSLQYLCQDCILEHVRSSYLYQLDRANVTADDVKFFEEHGYVIMRDVLRCGAELNTSATAS